MVSFSEASPAPFSDAMVHLLVLYRWRRIAVLFDVAYAGIRPRTRVQCDPVSASLRAPVNNLNYIELFTSSLGNMTDALDEAQKFTRSITFSICNLQTTGNYDIVMVKVFTFAVIFICMLGEPLKKLLVR